MGYLAKNEESPIAGYEDILSSNPNVVKDEKKNMTLPI